MTSDRVSPKHSQKCARFQLLMIALTILWPSPAALSQSPTNRPGAPIDITARELEGNDIQNNWLSYHGDLSGRRYSSLMQITRDNVHQLELKWVFHSRKVKVLGAAPVVVGGVMYVTASNDLFALDGRTGAVLWHRTQGDAEGGPDEESEHTNRGVAVFSNRLYMESDDNHLLSLDARSGNLLWDTPFSAAAKYGGAGAPIVVQGEVIVGSRGSDDAQGVAISAIDTESGKELWRFKMPPQIVQSGSSSLRAEPPKNSKVSWMPGTYDPELRLIFVSTDSEACRSVEIAPADEIQHGGCLFALDPGTGKLKWHSQLPEEEFSSTAISRVPVLVDLSYQGANRKELIVAQSSGYLTIFDRVTGHLISQRNLASAQSSLEQNHSYPSNAIRHRVMYDDMGSRCPQGKAHSNWNPPSYSEQSHLFYFAGLEECRAKAGKGADELKRAGKPVSKSIATSALVAYDPAIDSVVWRDDVAVGADALTGSMSTASNLLLFGGQSQSFQAADALTGKVLWSFHMGQDATSPPISYALGARQYFAIAAGNDLFVFGLP